MTNPVVVLIDSPTSDTSALHVVDASLPHVDVMDLGITRGDGIFETVGIVDGRVHAVEEHLTRFAHSASILDLPAPSALAFRSAVELGIAELDDASDAYCKYVMTRGRESGPVGRPGEPSGPTGYAYLDVNPSWTRERTEGIDVVLLSRGYQLSVQSDAPWLLQGAKTLSYGVNRAVLREAARRGAEDVLFTTIDGYVLEGPTSSLVARFGNEVVTPAQSGGVLHGTAQIGAFSFFAAAGYTTTYRDVRIAELADADDLWLTNSQRLAAPIRSLDGRALGVDAELTGRLNEALRGR